MPGVPSPPPKDYSPPPPLEHLPPMSLPSLLPTFHMPEMPNYPVPEVPTFSVPDVPKPRPATTRVPPLATPDDDEPMSKSKRKRSRKKKAAEKAAAVKTPTDGGAPTVTKTTPTIAKQTVTMTTAVKDFTPSSVARDSLNTCTSVPLAKNPPMITKPVSRPADTQPISAKRTNNQPIRTSVTSGMKLTLNEEPMTGYVNKNISDMSRCCLCRCYLLYV